jgi:hypothetical protein
VYDNDVPPLATGFVSEPGIFDCIETWEHWLTEVRITSINDGTFTENCQVGSLERSLACYGPKKTN